MEGKRTVGVKGQGCKDQENYSVGCFPCVSSMVHLQDVSSLVFFSLLPQRLMGSTVLNRFSWQSKAPGWLVLTEGGAGLLSQPKLRWLQDLAIEMINQSV